MLNTKLPKFHYKQTPSLLSNGDFASGRLTGWTAAAGWSAGTGAAVHSAGIGDTTPLVQAVPLVNGKTYGVSVTTSGRTAGTLTLTFGALAGSYAVGPDGTYWQTFLATSSASFNLTFTPTVNFDGAVDEITVRSQDAVFPEYPNMDSNFDGAPVPIRIGDIHDIAPVCIDTVAKTYKLAGHAIHAINEVRTEKETLVLTADYTVDLATAQFTVLATPFLAANTTYYFVVEADYAESGTNHIHLKQRGSVYASGSLFTIDDSDVWSADTGHDLKFQIFGKPTLDDQEMIKINSAVGATTNIGLKDAAARTRLAQSFLTGATGFYCTRIVLNIAKSGAPTGNLRVAILSAYTPAEVQLGVKSAPTVIARMGKFKFFFPLRSEVSSLSVDIEGAEEVGGGGVPITICDETLKYLTQTVLGKPATLLDATYLADLATDRTQAVKLDLDYETDVGAVVGTLETGQLWKLVPLLDGTYGTVVYEAGEPANTPHFRDEDYLSFRMWLDYSAVKSRIVVKCDKGAQEYKTEQASSDLARFFYLNEETLEVETMLRESAGATWLAGALGGMYAQPPLMVEFEVHGWGMDLIPGRDKVKLTRTRAMYASGTLNAVLFRILRLQKRPGTSTVVVTAIRDTQSY
ncbi:MAG: hypothetical protein IMZ71_04140 [Chloroflexi bacterium]|nr:hypothetical protein [Chloroflexota bacterium]